MTRPPTMSVGPLGSTIHALHADPETIAALAAIDWTRRFRRVCLDPVRGMITLMSPSRQHEDLSETIGDLVKIAANAFGRTTGGIRSTRLRGPDEPSGTGMEPDCAFYIGERAEGYRSARIEGGDAADAFVLHTAPDLVVEVEVTSVDEGKAERYGQMGVREMWRLRTRRGSSEIDADFLMLRPDAPPANTARFEGSGGSGAGGRPRGAGAASGGENPERSHGGGDSHRPPAPAEHAAHPGRGARLPVRGPARHCRVAGRQNRFTAA